MSFDKVAKDFAREPVPEQARKGWTSLAAVWSATFLCIPVLALAFQVAPRMTFYELIFYAFFAGTIVTLMACSTGWVGVSTRLSSGMIFKTTFGKYGGIFPCLAIAVSTLGWFGLQTEIFGNGLQNLLNMVFGWQIPVWGCIIFGAALMSITGAIGFKALTILSYLTIPLMLYVVGWPVFNVLTTAGSFDSILSYQPADPIAWHAVATLVVGGILGGIVANPDFTRYMRTKKDMMLGTSANFLVLYPIMLISGGFLALFSGESDFMKMMLSLNLGVAAMIFLVLGTWTTNDTNIYGTSLPLAAIVNIKKWQIAIFAAAIGTGLALLGILAQFLPFLILLGLLLAPLTGIMVIDFIFNRAKYEKDAEKNWNLFPFIAWIFGGLVGLSTTPADNNGLALFDMTFVPPLGGLFVAAFTQFMFIKYWAKRS